MAPGIARESGRESGNAEGVHTLAARPRKALSCAAAPSESRPMRAVDSARSVEIADGPFEGCKALLDLATPASQAIGRSPSFLISFLRLEQAATLGAGPSRGVPGGAFVAYGFIRVRRGCEFRAEKVDSRECPLEMLGPGVPSRSLRLRSTPLPASA